MKTQLVRLIDVFFIGPYLIYHAGKLDKTPKNMIKVIGLATIIYNGINYLQYEKAKKLENNLLRPRQRT